MSSVLAARRETFGSSQRDNAGVFVSRRNALAVLFLDHVGGGNGPDRLVGGGGGGDWDRCSRFGTQERCCTIRHHTSIPYIVGYSVASRYGTKGRRFR